MTRPTLTPDPTGTYRPRLEQELHEAMTREPKTPGRAEMTLKSAGMFLATVLAGFGVLIGMLVVCGFALVFWVMRKVWRVLR